ncbi:MAG: endonuclease/exonuclease/phosphatase family protein, partial [Gammaproteobacteria bacterium]
MARQTNFWLSLPGFSLHFGNALLSRYSIRTVERMPLPPLSALESFAFGNHDALRAAVELGSPSVVEVWGLHLGVRDQPTRVSAAMHIASQLEGAKPVVLAGDFNSQNPQKTPA